MNAKVNGKIVLALAFVAAAVGSTTLCALCLGVLLFVVRDRKKASLGCDALMLCLVDSILYACLNAVNLLLRLVNISALTSFVSSVTSTVSGIVDIAILIVALMAAANAMKGEEIVVPLVGGKFDGIMEAVEQ